MLKIAIIKLGAKGDVVRTLAIAKVLKQKFPESKISWITKKSSSEVLENLPYIDKVFCLPYKENTEFDYLYNFDIEKEATELAEKIRAKKKYGFYSEGNNIVAFNAGAEYYLNTLYDDEAKKRNKKTYQEMMFDSAELPYNLEHAEIRVDEKSMNYAKDFAKKNLINKENLIGIHIGASPRWPSKAWGEEQLKKFILAASEKGYEILLFGGPDEIDRHKSLVSELIKHKIKIYQNNPLNTDKEFAALVDLCKVMICSDSFSLHISIALKKPTIGLFFCTGPHEVEGYGILKKLTAKKLEEFFPEKMDKYSKELTESIKAEEVLSAIEESTKKRVVNAIIKRKDEDKFLIIERKNEEIHEGKWAFPGGLLEENETAMEALRRELKEEVGLEIEKIVKKVSDYDYKDACGEERFGSCYLVIPKNENVKIGKEVADFKWVSLEEFDKFEHIEGLEEEALTALAD